MITMNLKSMFGCLLGAATLVVGLESFVLADAEGGDTSGQRALAADQDLVGTLPAIYLGDPGDPPSGEVGLGDKDRAASLKPSFVLVGTMGEIRESVLDAYGDGYVTIEALPQSLTTGVYEFCFHGDIIVAVDRVAIESQSLETRLRVGYDYLGGLGAVSGNGYQGKPFNLLSYEMTLPYASVLKSLATDDDTVSLDLSNQGVGDAYVGVTTYGGTAQIELISH